jgi:hypothetical protein
VKAEIKQWSQSVLQGLIIGGPLGFIVTYTTVFWWPGMPATNVAADGVVEQAAPIGVLCGWLAATLIIHRNLGRKLP